MADCVESDFSESDCSHDSYCTANDTSATSGSDRDIEQLSVTKAYFNEPLASSSDDNNSSEGLTDDEDGTPSTIIAQRFDGVLPVSSW